MSLVPGRWSMVVAIRPRSMGSEAWEGMLRTANSRLQGHRLRRWTVRLRLGHPDHRTWGLG